MINSPVISNRMAIASASEQPLSNTTASSKSRAPFWSRYSTIINFWLDALLLVLFVIQAWIFGILHVVFPRGAGSDWKIWGATPLDWSETLFTVFCIFAVGIVVHVMLHWNWICGVVATKFLNRKGGKDDGSYTLIGVGLIIVLLHVLAAGILAARVALVGPNSIHP